MDLCFNITYSSAPFQNFVPQNFTTELVGSVVTFKCGVNKKWSTCLEVLSKSVKIQAQGSSTENVNSGLQNMW